MLDPRIPLGVEAPKPFNPLATLQQLGDLKNQALERQYRQQQIQSAQTIEQKRLKDEEDQRAYEQLISMPDLTPDKILDLVRQHAPAKYQEVATWKAKLEEQAALTTEHLQASRTSAANAQKALQELGANTWAGVQKLDNSPLAFHGAALVLKDAFKDYPALVQHIEQYEQMVANGTPIAKVVEAGIASNAGASKQSIEAPGQVADTAVKVAEAPVKQQIAAATLGNKNLFSPVQQDEANARAAAQKNQTSLLALAQSRDAREAAKSKQDATLFDTSGGTGPTAPNPNGGRNEEFLKTLPTATADTVKRIVEGRQPLPTRFAANDTYWHTLLDLAGKYDPSFDAVNYNARSQTRTAFSKGKEAGMVNTLNTAIEHLDELSKVADALHDTGFTPMNAVVNRVASTTNPAVNNFNTVLHRVAPELVQAYRGSGGAEADIVNNMKDFSISNTKEMNRQAIAETAKLLESKVRKLEEQYQQGMGTDTIKVVSPKAQDVLNRLAGQTSAPPQVLAAGPGRHTFANGQTWDVAADGKSATQVKK